MKLEPSQLIDNRYQIIRKLDQGGMGAVWKATDTKLGDEVVLKIPLEIHDSGILRRFGDEIETMRKLAKHCPFVLNILDVGEINGQPFYVMQYQAGGSLRHRITETFQNSTPEDLNWSAESFQWLPRIAEALDYLHGKDFIHRDVKPENILFSESGDQSVPYLADFGIVKDLNSEKSIVTDPRNAIGSWGYWAREILVDGQHSPRSDQYALAVSVYEVISGEHPYAGSNLFTLQDAFKKGYRKLSDISGLLPAAASSAVDQALSQNPADRFGSCQEFARAFLQGFSNNTGPSEAPTGMAQVVGRSGLAEVIGGGKVVDPPQSQAPSSSGSFFTDSRDKAVQPTKTAPFGDNGSSKPLLMSIAGLLLVGLFCGGLYLSGVLSKSPTVDQGQTTATNSSLGPAPIESVEKLIDDTQIRPEAELIASNRDHVSGPDRIIRPKELSDDIQVYYEPELKASNRNSSSRLSRIKRPKNLSDDIEVFADIELKTGTRDGLLTVYALVPEGYHTYSLTQPAGGPTITTLKLNGTGLKLTGKFAPDQEATKHDAEWIGPVEEYRGTVVWTVPVQVTADVAPADLKVKVEMYAQICDDETEQCRPPTTYSGEILYAGSNPDLEIPKRPAKRDFP